jgi:4-hydroxybenzoate polyprenyltransferase/phosphoserine phosphatase
MMKRVGAGWAIPVLQAARRAFFNRSAVPLPGCSSHMSEASLSTPTTTGVLFVDMDGTLIATDLFAESILAAMKQDPSVVLRMPFWAGKGRAYFKRQVADRVRPDVRSLPLREEVLDFIAEERERGRRIVLATASDERWAREVADQLGLFDDVIASDGVRNLKGSAKLVALEEYCRVHGFERFDYVGDAPADLPIWVRTEHALAVAPSASLRRALVKSGVTSREFGLRGSKWKTIIQLIRPKQWVKNLLLFVPLIMAHGITDWPKFLACCIAFVTFSLCASSVYVVNDLLDVDADRVHPKKRFRPFAAGTVPMMYGPPLAVLLCLAGLGLAFAFLPWRYGLVLIGYYGLSSAYSFWLKRKVMVDVVLLASLYAVRIIAGGLAVELPASDWLIAFSLFIFTSLAFAKRYAELRRLAEKGDHEPASGRGYMTSDLRTMEIMGMASGFLAVLVLVLYIQHDKVKVLYPNSKALWFLCPLFLYWVGRLWIMAGRGEMQEDPVSFTIRDRKSLVIGGLAAIILWLAALNFEWPHWLQW